MSIVVTPIPRLIDLAAPAFTLGTANAAGSAETAVASDSTLLAFDAVAVDAITLGQSGSVGTATVAPRRDHAHAMEALPAPVFGRVKNVAGAQTTTSTSLVDVTGATITFTTGAFPVHYSAALTTQNNTTGADVMLNVDVDGSLELGAVGLFSSSPVGDYYQNTSFSGQTVALSAASHTLKLQWSVGSGTGRISSESDVAFMWSAFEIR